MPLRLYRRPDSPLWWIRGSVRGVRVHESAGTERVDLAEERRATREAELYRAAIHGTKKRIVTFAEAAASYLEVTQRSAGTGRRLHRLLERIGPIETCETIDQERIDRLAAAVLRSGCSSATRLREIVTPMRAVLDHAARRGWCAMPAFESIHLPPARTLWLEPAEAERIIAASAPHVVPLLAFLFCSGCRLSEAIALEWAHVDLRNRRATIRQGKTDRDRIVELVPRAIGALKQALCADSRIAGTRVFRRPDGAPYADHGGLYGGHIKRAWDGALRRSGIKKPATPHTCRHSWASWRYAVHHDLLRLKDEGGWRSVALVERYAHLAPDGIASAALAFWGVKQPKTAPKLTRKRKKRENIE